MASSAESVESNESTDTNTWSRSRVFHNGSTPYFLECILGEGSYGKVVKCKRLDTCKTVAIKLIKNEPGYTESAKAEVRILKHLRKLDPDRCNLVRWHQVFSKDIYVCLEFELLDRSLSDLLMERKKQPLSLSEIRVLVRQVALALYYLKSVGIIHADIKLNNVMLVNHKTQPYKLKLIDFGLAHHVSAAKPGTCLQSLPYRSPEILLGLPYNTAIDVWSLGCMAVNMYCCAPLYPAETEYDMVRDIEQTLGKLPDHLLDKGLSTSRYFCRADPLSSSWRLKTPKEFFRDRETRTTRWKTAVKVLDDILDCRIITSAHRMSVQDECRDIEMFVDMVKGMLHPDAALRLSPRGVAQHQFINMSHMSSGGRPSAYATTCHVRMDACYRKPSVARFNVTKCRK